MNSRFEAVNLDEPAELSFKEKKGQTLAAIDMIPFASLSAALKYAVETMHDSHRPRCMITTRSGSVHHWSEIAALCEHVKIAR
ncbi:hypothetical protein [Hoeflea sp. 108]|jgi:hypothetical protein|uniref:hypothetical protein n=1 Tax=Hoeflea sp. 108 TaxID=1116369 RepID=UPI000378BEDD|nr:hypothetical protein [Hoeflea sp. 108]